ncbi:MAG: M14 family zinc carboxypeptidase [Planctomycetota bacterium]
MTTMWTYRDWKAGGERTTIWDLTFDSTIHCGAAQNFHEVGPNHIRFRARAGLEPYAWRFHFCIESPGDGREVVLEVADFNNLGGELWQEQAAVWSRDGEKWEDLGLENIRIVPWTPTGGAEDDLSLQRDGRRPYGVRYRLSLDAPRIWLASPTPYTLERSRRWMDTLASRCDFFHVKDIAQTTGGRIHGHALSMIEVRKPGPDKEKLRVVIVAGEHPAEVAGMYACEGVMEEILRTTDLLGDFSFWIVPVANVDGLAFGRTYHTFDPDDPHGEGLNLARDWHRRTQSPTQAIWKIIEDVKPHCVINLHNGRHRRRFEVFAPPQPHLATLLKHIREQMPLPVARWRPYSDNGALAPAVIESKLADVALCFETLLLVKLPERRTFEESYRHTGRCLLRGIVRGLREIYGRPQMLALKEVLGTHAQRCGVRDFVAKIPWFYYEDSFDDPREHNIWNFEVNGLPLAPGHYDAWLQSAANVESLRVRTDDSGWAAHKPRESWILLPSLWLPGRKLAFDFEHKGENLPIEQVIISPEGTPLETARSQAEKFDRYVRDTKMEAKRYLWNWGKFRENLMRDSFGVSDLRGMFDEIVDWLAQRQVCDPQDRYYGAVHSEEDKYDARDAAAAAACFARRYSWTKYPTWLDRALKARRYAYLSQIHEPGNEAHDGGFVHMVKGIWGVNFTRLEPPYPGIDGVDTCVILHLLCRCADLGLPLEAEDRSVLRRAATWVANNEALPGVFLHHEGATHDCQNANSLGLSALVRTYHTLARLGDNPPRAWLEAASRGIEHYLDGQEAIGVWPYLFAQVGHRGQAFHFDNIPDHGIGLYHMTRACHEFPLCDRPALTAALKRAARWYLGLLRLDGNDIDLEYDACQDLGNDICFSGFTWCRFTAAAALLRIARAAGEVEPWRHLALRLMEHVRRKLWQRNDASRAPVVAHARADAKLATWCQAAEWDAAMLAEMIEDIQRL